MKRSNCVICNKKRNHSFLKKLIDFQNIERFVCNKGTIYYPVNRVNYSFNPCQVEFINNQTEALIKQIYILNQNIESTPNFYKLLSAKNVTPDLTFLLQLKCQINQ